MKRQIALLFLFYILFIGISYFISIQTSGFSFEAYDVIRQVDAIKTSGTPLFDDSLSQGGRDRVFNPIYYYFMTALSFIFSLDIIIKLILPIIFGLSIFLVYLITKIITENEVASIISSFFMTFIPINYFLILNNGAVYNLLIPLYLLSIFCFLKSNTNPKYLYYLIISFVALSLFHPASILLGFSFVVYLLLLKFQAFKETRKEQEVAIFFLIFSFWLTSILFQRAFTTENTFFVWQNIPTFLLDSFYLSDGLQVFVFSLGIIIIALTLIGVYNAFFVKRKKHLLLIISLIILPITLMILQIIPLSITLLLIAPFLAIVSGYSISLFLEQTKLFKFNKISLVSLTIILALQIALFLPSVPVSISLSSQGPTKADLDAYEYLKNLEKGTVWNLPKEGFAISYYTNKPVLIDEDFLLVPNINRRFSDSYALYRDRFLTTAIERLIFYEAKYILISKYAKQYGFEELLFADDECIVKIYGEEESPKIYELRCGLSD